MSDSNCTEPAHCEPNEETVMVSSGNADVPVSFQVLQDIYNEITGKTEEIENTYKIKYKIKFEDIEQLYIKIQQLFEQYNIKSNNCSVTIFFIKGSKEVFSSFERFKLLNTSTLNETERIYLKFNFMIILPKTKRIQRYEIKVNLSSSIAVGKRINEEMMPSSKLFRFVVGNTAQVSINYVDYLVARNFMDTIDEWLKCLPANKTPKIRKYISRKSHLFPIFLKNIFFLLSVYLLWIKFDFFIPIGSTDLHIFTQFLIIALPFTYFSLRFGWSIGSFTENAIDDHQPLSFICLTRGDETLIEETETKNKKRLLKAVFGLFIAFVIGILASVVANTITK
jgi:hypothetical protein